MEKNVEKSRLRWAKMLAAELQQLTKAAAVRVANAPEYSPASNLWERGHFVKWQCHMSLEESAALDTIRKEIIPGGVSRYGLVRMLLIALSDISRERGGESGQQ